MKIALIGYGKMGHMIEQIALERGHEIVCKIDIDNADDFDSPAFASADVAIEFTNPTAAYGNYLRAFKHNGPVPGRQADPFLGEQLLSGRGHLPGCQQEVG
mgnify:CR=1 FL=1